MTFVLFDFDGPIVNLFALRSGQRVAQSVLNIAIQFGNRRTEITDSSGFISLWQKARREIIDSGRDVTLFDRDVHIAIEKHELEMVHKVSLAPAALTMLTTVHRSAEGVAIVSNNSAHAIADWVSKNQLVHLVDFISGREAQNPFESLKPSPALVNRAIKGLGCKPEMAIFVGDTEADYLSSLAAGVFFIGLRTRHTTFSPIDVRALKGEFLANRAAVSRRIIAKMAVEPERRRPKHKIDIRQ